ncbi:hypothetical protein [uncultured Nocardioides sp.]|uniref:hypothetical protein n=1 Tax=uncultured Nocardioides sp. TaxID=198441 RepID=UPI002614AB9F|nr:hypothetical protein [uncultured Nocardioides sp.]
MNHLQLGRLGGQLGVGLTLVGFLVIFFGWNGAAAADYVPAQLPYLLSAGAAGLGLVVVGAAMIVVQSQRADRVRLEQALERVALAAERGPAAVPQTGQHAGLPGGLGNFVVTGRLSYHRVECDLHEARAEATLVPLHEVIGGTLTPCRVCNPPHLAARVPS